MEDKAALTCKIATMEDWDMIQNLITLNCSDPNGVITEENYKTCAQHVLSDVDWGFFILAQDSEGPKGMMYFTYEWSDWRNGVFFWLQNTYCKEKDSEETFKAMLGFLEEYQKTRGCCGYRLCTEKTMSE